MIKCVLMVVKYKDLILLSQRSCIERSFPGQWHFPGGKVEKDETDFHAILREMNEELGFQRAEIVDVYPFVKVRGDLEEYEFTCYSGRILFELKLNMASCTIGAGWFSRKSVKGLQRVSLVDRVLEKLDSQCECCDAAIANGLADVESANDVFAELDAEFMKDED